MTIKINNEEVVTQVATVTALAQELGLPAHGVALAINNCVVRHERWDTTPIHEGDSLTIFKAAYGG